MVRLDAWIRQGDSSLLNRRSHRAGNHVINRINHLAKAKSKRCRNNNNNVLKYFTSRYLTYYTKPDEMENVALDKSRTVELKG